MSSPCFFHPDRQTMKNCAQCGMAICPDCGETLGGHDVCKQCAPAFKIRFAEQIRREEELAASIAAQHAGNAVAAGDGRQSWQPGMSAFPGAAAPSLPYQRDPAPAWSPQQAAPQQQTITLGYEESEQAGPFGLFRIDTYPWVDIDTTDPGKRLIFGIALALVAGLVSAVIWAKTAFIIGFLSYFSAIMGYVGAYTLIRVTRDRSLTIAVSSAVIAFFTQLFGYFLLTYDELSRIPRFFESMTGPFSMMPNGKKVLDYVGIPQAFHISFRDIVHAMPGEMGLLGMIFVGVGCCVAYLTPRFDKD